MSDNGTADVDSIPASVKDAAVSLHSDSDPVESIVSEQDDSSQPANNSEGLLQSEPIENSSSNQTSRGNERSDIDSELRRSGRTRSLSSVARENTVLELSTHLVKSISKQLLENEKLLTSVVIKLRYD